MIYCSCSYILSYLILFVTTTIMRFDKLAEVFKKSPLEVNMKYLSAKETAKKWGIGERRVQTLCLQDRIPGRKVGHKGAAVHAGSEKACNKSAGSSLRKGKTGAGSRASFFAIRTLVLAVIFACMLAGFQMMTRASSREKEQTYKYYTTVTIGYGEDLSDIVYRYCDSSEYENADAYVREVCDINSLPYTRGSVPALHPGAKIVIPYFSTVLK